MSPDARVERLTAERIAEIRAVLDYGGPISNAAGRALLDAAERVEVLERALGAVAERADWNKEGLPLNLTARLDSIRNGALYALSGTARTPQPGRKSDG